MIKLQVPDIVEKSSGKYLLKKIITDNFICYIIIWTTNANFIQMENIIMIITM